MKHSPSSRPVIVGVLALIFLVLSIGISQTFSSVRAAPVSPSALDGAAWLQAATPTPSRSATCAPRSVLPSPTPTATPTLPAADKPPSTDTSGVIAFAVLMVAIILFGVLWAGRKPPVRKSLPARPKRKKGTSEEEK